METNQYQTKSDAPEALSAPVTKPVRTPTKKAYEKKKTEETPVSEPEEKLEVVEEDGE